MERFEGWGEKGRRQEEGAGGLLGGRKETWLKWKGLWNGTVALRAGARSWCDSNLMVGRYSLAEPDGLEKSVMTSSWQHHPNLFLIYTLHIMHSYNVTRKNKRLKRTGMIRGYSHRWRNEKYADGSFWGPSERKKNKKRQTDYDFKEKTIVSSFTNPHAAKTIWLSFFYETQKVTFWRIS